MTLFSSDSAFAQGKIGGGGYLDPPNYDYVFTNDESEGSIQPQSLKEAQFTYAISSREKVCRPNGEHYLQDHGRELLKLYFDLVGLQNNFQPDASIPDLDSYYECLFSPYVKQTLKELLEDKEMAYYLSKKHKIPLVRISLMLVHFQLLHQECYTDVCAQ